MTASKIKEYLQKNGIMQKWLAEQINIPESRLSNILNNKSPLYADLLFQICQILGVSSEEFKNNSTA